MAKCGIIITQKLEANIVSASSVYSLITILVENNLGGIYINHYSSEFRRLAVWLSDEIGSRDTARWLGLSYNTLSAWRQQKSLDYDKNSEMSDSDIDLRQEVAYLREANEILLSALDRLLELKGN